MVHNQHTMAPSSTVKSPRASAARFIRREPWVTLNMAVAFGAATVFLSIAWLEAFGIVRVFTVVTTHPSGAISGDRVLGIESVSRTLTHTRSEALLVLAVAFTFWVLRVALQTADHQIGLLRTVGLLMPPITLGVLAGAMHAITDGGRERRVAAPGAPGRHVLVCAELGRGGTRLVLGFQLGHWSRPHSVRRKSFGIDARRRDQRRPRAFSPSRSRSGSPTAGRVSSAAHHGLSRPCRIDV